MYDISFIKNYIDLEDYLESKKLDVNGFHDFLKENNIHAISGSLVYGHGTPTSDIDTFRICDVEETDNFFYQGVRIDLKKIEKNRVDSLSALIAEADIQNPGFTFSSIGMKEESVVKRRPMPTSFI